MNHALGFPNLPGLNPEVAGFTEIAVFWTSGPDRLRS